MTKNTMKSKQECKEFITKNPIFKDSVEKISDESEKLRIESLVESIAETVSSTFMPIVDNLTDEVKDELRKLLKSPR